METKNRELETLNTQSDLLSCTNSDCEAYDNHILPADSKFCPYCGTQFASTKDLDKTDDSSKMESRSFSQTADNLFVLGYKYDNGVGVQKDLRLAVKYYTMAAEQDHTDAQYRLAWLYQLGAGTERDKTKAFYWYKKAAEQGHADAQYYLGMKYYLGEDITRDYKEAMVWFIKAAKQGHADAQYELGMCYKIGMYIVEEDYLEALKWFLKIIDQKNLPDSKIQRAQRAIGDIYRYGGKNVEKDLEKAKYWYRKAYGIKWRLYYYEII